MFKLKCKKIFVFILAVLIGTIILNLKFGILSLLNTFEDFANAESKQNKIIPNIIHYIIFNQHKLNFALYLSIISSIKFQNPDIIYLHTNQEYFNGIYWKKIKNLNNSKSVIHVNYFAQPTHVFGQQLSSVYHSADVARIIILQKWGGIYLDTDVLILKNLDPFRHFEMVVGWPENEYMGTQILLARKRAHFLSAWLDGYRRYVPTNWYYNAGQYPTQQILEKTPHLAHRVNKSFGVQNLLHYLYETHDAVNWTQYYAIHLLSRHSPAVQYFNESLVDQINNTFGEIARHLLSKINCDIFSSKLLTIY